MTAHRHNRREGSKPAFIAALVVTIGYALVELAGGLWSASLALISDAGHMFSDAAALGLAAASAWLARRPAGSRHSYGWARAEVIGATLNGLVMLVIIVVLVVEAVQRLLQPRPVFGGAVMLIAFVGLLINGVVALMLSRDEDDFNARAALLHVMGDLLGSVAALTAGAVIYFTGWLPIDPILSLAIAGLILVSTLRLLRDTLHVLMEGVPAAIDLTHIGRTLAGVAGVTSVHDLHIWSITPGRVALSAHLEVEQLNQWPEVLERVRTLLHDRFGIDHVTLQPEEKTEGRPETAVVTVWPRGRRPQT
jgi:cobalt-zinc-cadmium efflux system protein